jgi:ABC-type nitrate/sulfonate/bicarbonate transport system permease component
MLLPVGRSGWAIAAGYVGLVSVLLVPAPLAIILSIIAVRSIKKSKTTDHPKHGMGRAIFGLVMGILFTSILGFWVLVVATAHHKYW